MDLSKLRLYAGLGYALSVLFVWILIGPYKSTAYITGIVALLVWLSDVPGPVTQRLAGIIGVGGACIVFSLLTHLLGESFWPHVVLLFVAAFLGTAVMVFGTRAFLAGWVFIIWAIVAPLFEMSTSLSGIVSGLSIGTAVVAVVVVAAYLVTRRLKTEETADTGPSWRESLAANANWKFETFGYATVVALVMVVTSIIGWKSVATDPSWVANAALMVIGADPQRLGFMGVQRALGTVLGIVAGFWLIQILSGPAVLIAATFAVSFLIVATMNVNYIMLAFFWTVFMSLEWSLKGQEHVATASMERIQAELLGIAIAVAAVYLLSVITKRRRR